MIGQCEEDCVWPGDLNANGIANNLDILALGFSINATGPARANTSTDWEPLFADNWAGELPELGANFKHSDADGNGIVDESDRFPVSINYNFTNDLFTGLLGNDLLGEDLFVVAQNDVTSPSGSYILDIHLGDATNIIDSIYGIGFQIVVDTQLVESVNFDFSDSWIGTDEDILTYGKYSDEIEHIGTAITRLDGNAVSGFGKIAQLEIVITDVVLGLITDTTSCLPFYLDFENVLGIDNQEMDMMISAQNDSLTLKHDSQLVSTSDIESFTPLKVYPNPAKETIFIEDMLHVADELIIYNALGQKVRSLAIREEVQAISIDDLQSGIYLLSFTKQEQFIFNHKILITQ